MIWVRALTCDNGRMQYQFDPPFVSESNLAAEEEHRLQSGRMAEILAELAHAEADVKRLTEQQQKLSGVKRADDENASRETKELETSSEQLKVMADKVMQLLGQLQKMEETKQDSEAEKRALKTFKTTMIARADQLNQKLEVAERQREKLESQNKQIEERLARGADELDELKHKYLATENSKDKLLGRLDAVEKELSEVCNSTCNDYYPLVKSPRFSFYILDDSQAFQGDSRVNQRTKRSHGREALAEPIRSQGGQHRRGSREPLKPGGDAGGHQEEKRGVVDRKGGGVGGLEGERRIFPEGPELTGCRKGRGFRN